MFIKLKLFTFAKKKKIMENKFIKICTIACLLSLLLSCNKETVSNKIDAIKKVGDSDPTLALAMLDSLSISIVEQPEKIKNKYFLAKLRVQDKADIIPQSDISAKKLLAYYTDKGTDLEKQEVYFYAGSVYRDLHDMPRSLEYFLKSAEVADTNTSVDSVMLRNTFSNLFYLFYNVQDYDNAYKYAKKEFDISKKINKIELTCLMHMGTSLVVNDNKEKAKEFFTHTLDTISSTPKLANNIDILCSLLADLSFLKDAPNASKCFHILENKCISNLNDNKCFAYGEYYNLIGERDSAIFYYNCILQNQTDFYRMYDASKALYHIYNQSGQSANANWLAEQYIKISDSIDLGKRQELAATVNNQFQYHKDENKEKEIIKEKERFRSLLNVAVILIFAIILLSVSIIIYRRNVHLRKVLKLSNELNEIINDRNKLHDDIRMKENEINEYRKVLTRTENDLGNVKKQLDRVNEELKLSEEELEKKERLLSERIAQNQSFLNLLHQSELEGSAEDVIYAIRKSSEGKKNMSSADWKQLYKAVDELYPAFKDKMIKELVTFTEQQMQVCYLMRIGISKTQIQNMTNLSRVTIWRWFKKYEWVMTPDDEM